ncbi:MAG: protease modulator HflC [Myxococcota bacterium]|nr:protease modulator HflC [Myxococcota bacterium]
MRGLLIILLVLALLVGGMSYGGFGPIVLNAEGEQRLTFFLGNPVTTVTEPGISFTYPFVTTQVFDGRWRHLSSSPKEIPTFDQERIVVDHYVVWRISDPLRFRRRFPIADEADKQIDQLVRGQVREVIGQKTLTQVLKDERTQIMDTITDVSQVAVKDFGVEIADVRINRTELPKGTEGNVFARMRAERERLAKKYRAEGEEQARRIRAEADRESTVLVAEARGAAEVARGTGDAESVRIYAEAYGRNAEFYEFQRNLEAYEKTLGEGTTLVLPPDHEFFKLLGGSVAPQ